MAELYAKPALTVEEQADKLLSRGLIGISKEELIKKLSIINYYRLRGYTYPYQNNSLPDAPFLSGACWNYIWNDYVFDLQLRSLLFEAIGQIEITLRTRLELTMSLAYGAQWYEKESLFFNVTQLLKDQSELKKDWERSREIFKEHYDQKYDTSLAPPAWMIFETTTFGTVSKFFANINRSEPAKEEIASFFGFNKASTKVLVSWLQHLNLVRNICAHHSRLFSRSFIIRPYIPTTKPKRWVASWPAQDRLFVSVCIITYLLDICAPENEFRARLIELFKQVRPGQLPSMGFPMNWKEQPLFAVQEQDK